MNWQLREAGRGWRLALTLKTFANPGNTQLNFTEPYRAWKTEDRAQSLPNVRILRENSPPQPLPPPAHVYKTQLSGNSALSKKERNDRESRNHRPDECGSAALILNVWVVRSISG